MIFFKYHSLQNDFVLLDGLENDLPNLTLAQIQKLCHRHQGIGADGVIVIAKDQTAKGLFEMFFYNPDGSLAERCLNGVRCAAYHYYRTHTKNPRIDLMIHGAKISCDLVETEGEVEIVLNAGSPIVCEPKTIIVNNQTVDGYAVEMGNPHFVILQSIDLKDLAQIGAGIESHAAFSNRTNVEFLWSIQKNIYQLYIYERGCGITQACGSGAAAALFVLYKTNKIEPHSEFILQMPGGNLVSWVNDHNEVLQRATAHFIAEGEYSLT